MAGHSKWANIRHRKERQDKKKGQQWSKCSKAIMAAARQGGPDPDANLALRYAIEEAKYVNMPKDTIKRAIEKGAGAAGGEDFAAITYEGYGPAGIAVIVDALTDNRTRTVNELRYLFSKYGGNLGQSGSVAFMFKTHGQIIIPAGATDEETLMELALETGADDVESPEEEDGYFIVSTPIEAFITVKEAIENAGITIEQAQITKTPENSVALAGDEASKLLALVESIEDNDDVQKVYTNADIDESALA